MKRLIFVNGTMGVGKTAFCKELLGLMEPAVFLDGDWCWHASPFAVTDETKAMVESNIIFLLRSFLGCSAYQTVIFCWVMDRPEIAEVLLRGLRDLPYALASFTLTATPEALTRRLQRDVAAGLRKPDILPRSLERLPRYEAMDTIKIDVSRISPREAALAARDSLARSPAE